MYSKVTLIVPPLSTVGNQMNVLRQDGLLNGPLLKFRWIHTLNPIRIAAYVGVEYSQVSYSGATSCEFWCRCKDWIVRPEAIDKGEFPMWKPTRKEDEKKPYLPPMQTQQPPVAAAPAYPAKEVRPVESPKM